MSEIYPTANEIKNLAKLIEFPMRLRPSVIPIEMARGNSQNLRKIVFNASNILFTPIGGFFRQSLTTCDS